MFLATVIRQLKLGIEHVSSCSAVVIMYAVAKHAVHHCSV